MKHIFNLLTETFPCTAQEILIHLLHTGYSSLWYIQHSYIYHISQWGCSCNLDWVFFSAKHDFEKVLQGVRDFIISNQTASVVLYVCNYMSALVFSSLKHHPIQTHHHHTQTLQLTQSNPDSPYRPHPPLQKLSSLNLLFFFITAKVYGIKYGSIKFWHVYISAFVNLSAWEI